MDPGGRLLNCLEQKPQDVCSSISRQDRLETSPTISLSYPLDIKGGAQNTNVLIVIIICKRKGYYMHMSLEPLLASPLGCRDIISGMSEM